MKLIDKLLRKFGYVKISQVNRPINLEEKFDIEMVRMEYEVSVMEFMHCASPAVEAANYEEEQIKKFLLSLAPFAERRQYKSYPLGKYYTDGWRYELRIFVAKPKHVDNSSCKE